MQTEGGNIQENTSAAAAPMKPKKGAVSEDVTDDMMGDCEIKKGTGNASRCC